MASLDVIRKLTIRTQTEGVDQAVASVKNLTGATEGLAAASVKTEKATLSVDAALARTVRRFDQEAKAQQDLAKVQKDLNSAREAGRISQERQNQLMQLAVRHYNTAGDAAKKQSQAIQELSMASQGLAGNLGTVGGVLARIGPAGLAIAAALGAMTLGFGAAAAAALDLADKAGRLVDLSDTIGVTVVQLQALQLAGAQVGLENEKLATGLEKFGATLGRLRNSEKGAIDSFDRLGDGMAQSVASATSVGDALNIVFAALNKLDPAARRLAETELFGKGGAGFGRLAAATAAAGGSIDDLVSKMNPLDVITRKQAEAWDQLGDAINENLKLAKQNIQTTFAGPTLAILNEFSEELLKLSRVAKEIGTPIAEAFGQIVLDAIRTAREEVERFAASLEGLSNAEKLAKIGDALVDPRLVQTINDIIQVFKDLIEVIKAAAAALSAFLSAPFSLSSISQVFTDMSSAVANAQQSLRNLGTTLTTEGTRGAQALQPITVEVQDFSAAINDAVTSIPDFKINPEPVQRFGAATLQAASGTSKMAKAVKEEANPAIKELGQIAGQLGSSLVTAFLNGDSAAKALNSTLKSISSSAASSAINKLVSGDFSGAAVSGAISVGAAIGSFLFGDDEDEKAQQEAAKAAADAARAAAEALQQARDAFAGLSKDIQDFTNKANGTRIGELTQALAEFSDQSVKLQEAAIAAQNETALEAIRQTAAAGMNRFLRQFLGEVEDLISEFGTEGIMEQARESVREMMLQFSALQDSIDEFARRTGADTEILRQKLQTSTFKALVEMLGDVPEISDTVREIQRLKGVASELDDALVQLGISAEDAAFIVEARLNVSLRKLGAGLFDPIIREINAFVGGDWINQAADLFARVRQLTADATALGLDTTLIQTFYVLSAQNIINQNQLVGASFNALVRMLGIAASEVHEFNGALLSLARTAAEVANQIQANEDRLFLAVHRSDSLADQLARFDLAAQREREQEIAAGGQALASLERALAQERLNIINDFFDQQAQAGQAAADAAQQIADETARALQEAITFLEGATRRIQEWINHFLASAQSPLSPSQQLATAQQSFAAQYAAAISGNRDALNGITGNAQDIVEAARRYYGSSAPGQSIINTMLTQLQQLPSQLSPEQFIVDNLTPPIVDVGNNVNNGTATVADLLRNLKLAVESNDAQAIAVALLPLFDQLDTTMDQALSFAEFEAGLGSSFSSGTLKSIFDVLDLNGDQMLQKSELIQLNTGAAKGLLQTQIDRDEALAAETVLWLTQIWDKMTVMIQQQINANSYLQTIAAWAPGANHAAGGWIIGGTPGKDSVSAKLQPGEFVVREAVASRNPWLEEFNRTGMLADTNINRTGTYPTPANDNAGAIVGAIYGLERSLMRGIAALIEAELETAGIISAPIQEGNKIQRTRRGEKKKAA